jgi:PKD repeat protein
MLHWFPDFAAGTFTGQNQGPWNIVSNGQYIAAGGEFPRVNGTGQQGLVRFTFRDKAPNKVGPALRGGNFKVNALSVQPGAVRISWTANHDRDNENLTYTVLRGGSPIATLEQKSNNWTRPTMGHIDRNLAPGSYSYRVQVADPLGNSTISDNIPVTVSNDELAEYPAAVLADGASMYWRLGEPSGTGVFDWAGFNDGLATASGLTRGTPGAIGGDSNTATGFDGATGNVATTAAAPGPGTFGVETWVRTTSTSGGKILGFGNAATGNSSSYDRHLYMTNDGRFVFGVYPGFTATVQSKAGFNDGQWHHVAAGLSADGLVLYVDGKRVARNTGVTSAQDYSGFWRVGGDNLNGWPSRPSSSSFAGEIDDVAVYPAPLTPAAVTNHYTLSGRTPASGVRPADAYGQAVFDKQPDLYWRLNDTSGTTAKDITVNENDGTYFGGPGLDAEGILPGTKAVAFDGGDDGVGANTQASNPTVYSQEAWFNTTSTAGGKIIGFGSAQSGGSGSYDRHVYMFDDGRLRFGVWTGQTNVIDSAESYNDGDWHHLVATQGPDGMKLYVDGELVGTNPQTQAQAYNGYWRLGGDTTWGGNSSNYFNGLIDEAAVYSQVLTPAQIAQHYALGGGDVPPPPNQEPTASFTAVADGLAVAFDATGSSDPEGQPLTYAWDFGDGTTGTGATTTKTYGAAGTYQITLTVTDAGGLTNSRSAQVEVTSPPPGNTSPTANFTANATGLKVDLDASASTDEEGPIASYAWDFGDGTTGSGATATKTYASAGTYNVQLTVTDAGGLTDSRTLPVAVAGPTVWVSDTFSRTVVNGFGTAEIGGAWSMSGSSANYRVDGSAAVMRLGAPASQTTAWLGSVARTSSDVAVQISSDKAASGGGTYVTVVPRRISATNDYKTAIRILPTGQVTATLRRTVSGAETVIASGTVPGVSFAAGTKLNVRAQAVGAGTTTVRLKVWADGTAEPANWQFSVNDSTAALQTAGGVGFIAYLSGSASNAPVAVTFDNLQVGEAQ